MESMIKCLIALIALAPVVVSAQTVWTWVDENGRRHYSDTEVPGATPFEIGEAQTFSGSALTGGRSPATSSSAASETSPSATIYSTFDITSPAPEATLRNIEGNLSLAFVTSPVLGPGHRVDVVLDGVRQNLNVRSSPIAVPDVFRGEHTVRLVAIDSAGAIVQRSEPVRFYVQQTSVITSPAMRGRGAPPPAGNGSQ